MLELRKKIPCDLGTSKNLSAALLPSPNTVESVLNSAGFKRQPDGVIEVKLPINMSVQDFGLRANAEAVALGKSEVFNPDQKTFWAQNEENPTLRTSPGKTYRIKVGDPRIDQNRRFGQKQEEALAPIGVVVIAEICAQIERIRAAQPLYQNEFALGGIIGCARTATDNRVLLPMSRFEPEGRPQPYRYGGVGVEHIQRCGDWAFSGPYTSILLLS